MVQFPVDRLMRKGFTLSELLIALAILGVIATFTIPKVLQSQQNGSKNAAMKEAAGMVSGAFQAYKNQYGLSTTVSPTDLTPFMNYVAVNTASQIDHHPGMGALSCDSTHPCLRLHDGAVLFAPESACDFPGTASTDAIYFHFDPDGSYSGSTTGPGKGTALYVYYNGRVSSRDLIAPNTETCAGTHQPDPATNPSWMNW